MSGKCAFKINGKRHLGNNGRFVQENDPKHKDFYHEAYSRSNHAELNVRQAIVKAANREVREELVVPKVKHTLDGAQMKYLRERTSHIDFSMVLPLIPKLNFDVEKVIEYCNTQSTSEYVCECTKRLLNSGQKKLAFDKFGSEVKWLDIHTDFCDMAKVECSRKAAMSNWCRENGVEEWILAGARNGSAPRRNSRGVVYSSEYNLELRIRNALRIEELTRRQPIPKKISRDRKNVSVSKEPSPETTIVKEVAAENEEKPLKQLCQDQKLDGLIEYIQLSNVEDVVCIDDDKIKIIFDSKKKSNGEKKDISLKRPLKRKIVFANTMLSQPRPKRQCRDQAQIAIMQCHFEEEFEEYFSSSH